MPSKKYTLASTRTKMIYDKKLFTIVIILGTFAILVLATSIPVIGFNLLLIGNLLPGTITSGYLYIAWKKQQQRYSSLSHNSQRIRIPFVLMAILILPLIIITAKSVTRSYPLYLVVASIMLPWTFTYILFFLLMAIYHRFLNKDANNKNGNFHTRHFYNCTCEQ
jgi:hypothetical protein